MQLNKSPFVHSNKLDIDISNSVSPKVETKLGKIPNNKQNKDLNDDFENLINQIEDAGNEQAPARERNPTHLLQSPEIRHKKGA